MYPCKETELLKGSTTVFCFYETLFKLEIILKLIENSGWSFCSKYTYNWWYFKIFNHSFPHLLIHPFSILHYAQCSTERTIGARVMLQRNELPKQHNSFCSSPMSLSPNSVSLVKLGGNKLFLLEKDLNIYSHLLIVFTIFLEIKMCCSRGGFPFLIVWYYPWFKL